MAATEIARRQGVSPDAVKYHLANALSKLGLSRRAELRAFNGVRRDSALFHKDLDMTQPVSLGPVGQIARSVKDVAAARQWYGEVLGLPHLYSFGNLAFFDMGGVRLFLSEGDGAAQNPSSISRWTMCARPTPPWPPAAPSSPTPRT